MGLDGTYPLLFAVWLFPLVGAIVIWAFGPRLKTLAGPVACAMVLLAFVAAMSMWPEAIQTGPAHELGAHQSVFTWMPGFSFGILWDPLTLLWVGVITGVGFLIHFYSMGYMAGDPAYARFFAYLNFFVFAMLTLVLSDNFVGLLVGWGLVGLASYLLIGFYLFKPSAAAAARKAFVINVVGDVGILFAVFVLFAQTGSIGFGDAFAKASTMDPSVLLLACIALFVGAAAKSAQVPLHTWLPDAMEGPTPVSALIHAATMVTAGVYLIARCWPMWNASPDARELVGVIGAITALTGGILGTAQWDIKRILAYSTMSQIGYMILGVGVGAFEGGILHFFTHAFFKALLFLTSGIIIHNLANEQDTRLMGGLRKRMPFAFWAMLTGTLAICGIWPFSGFFSKDAVLYGTLERGHPILYAIGAITAALTAYYMFRLIFVVFFGEYRGNVDPSDLGIRHPELAGVPTTPGTGHDGHDEEHAHVEHAPAWLMAAPVAILMVPSIFVGWLSYGAGGPSPWQRFFDPVFGAAAEAGVVTPPLSELGSSILVLVLVAIGLGIAYYRYGTPAALRDAVVRLRGETVRMPAPLVHAFYFDAAIEALFVRPAQALGTFFGKIVDPVVIDGAVHEVTFSTTWLGHLMRSFQTGLLRAYALTIVFGAVCFAAYYAFVGAK